MAALGRVHALTLQAVTVMHERIVVDVRDEDVQLVALECMRTPELLQVPEQLIVAGWNHRDTLLMRIVIRPTVTVKFATPEDLAGTQVRSRHPGTCQE